MTAPKPMLPPLTSPYYLWAPGASAAITATCIVNPQRLEQRPIQHPDDFSYTLAETFAGCGGYQTNEVTLGQRAQPAVAVLGRTKHNQFPVFVFRAVTADGAYAGFRFNVNNNMHSTNKA
jgi:hypothetical protein